VLELEGRIIQGLKSSVMVHKTYCFDIGIHNCMMYLMHFGATGEGLGKIFGDEAIYWGKGKEW